MSKMTCVQCGKEIFSKPCPYCGSPNVKREPSVGGMLSLSGVGETTIVRGSSETFVERGGDVKRFKFDPGVNSGEIVNASLDAMGLRDVLPSYMRRQIVDNINGLEKYAQESRPTETTEEYSIEINFGVVKFGYKRTKKRSS
jgi:hypothetical protein